MANENPWDIEPDDLIFADPGTWARCRIIRGPEHRALTGYVAIPLEHPMAGHKANFIGEGHPFAELQVHGGITWSEPHFPAYAPDADVSLEGLWVLGFDCLHSGDKVPGLGMDGEYRTVEFVKNELAQLAKQLAEIDRVAL